MRLLPALLLLLPLAAAAAGPTAEAILKAYDAVMGPPVFEAENELTSVREDGSSRTYVMRFLKRDADKFRVWFREPASVKGQEILRLGDNMWVYLPNLKRATRVANRESFQGGDFNNADVLRVNYAGDYEGTLVPSDVPDTFCAKLKATHPETAYDAITLYVRRKDLQPVAARYYASSGKLLRSAEFSEVKTFAKGYDRPAKVVMRNELVPARSSTLVLRSLSLDVEAPPQRFMQTDLGR
ncbi:MAG: outer membrane lipoprotein-sorting protein [Deltaproteobacteria bacterium]|nr:outer membrane lipoprotein-sorting protein [Deltaproteobacteria bacterium]